MSLKRYHKRFKKLKNTPRPLRRGQGRMKKVSPFLWLAKRGVGFFEDDKLVLANKTINLKFGYSIKETSRILNDKWIMGDNDESTTI